ncbi:MAG: glutamine amidotransferase [Bradymonadaceae bacterium]
MGFFEAYNSGDLLLLGNWSPAWLILLAALGAAVIAISAYDLRSLPPARRWVLVGLRAVVYGLAVLLLLEPAVDLKDVSKVENHVAVLADTSRSMELKAGDGESTRYDRVRGALRGMKEVSNAHADEHQFHYFGFDGALTGSSRSSLENAEPSGAATDLAAALKQLDKNFRTRQLGGVVLLSDGIATGPIGERVDRGESLDRDTKAQLEELDAPVNTLAVGRRDQIKDVAVSRVQHDDFAFVHNKTSIEVSLQVVGVGETNFPVTLRRNGELVRSQNLQVRPDQTRYELTFEFVPKKIGKEIYTVAAPEFSDEILTRNNTAHFLQPVIRDKIRVLQVVGQPSWDERFLRRLLKKNPNVDLVSFFILRTSSSVQVVPPDELSLIPFPTRELFEEQLGSFDLVVFQNFNFGPYNMRKYLPSISEFVRNGGGFAMIGGNHSFADGGYARTPIEDILPVRLPSAVGPGQMVDPKPFEPELTEAGERHPITQMAFSPSRNRELWKGLPKWEGTNIVGRAKAGATVLARHPSREAGGAGMPVLSISEVGDGRVMALTTDSSWRWGFTHVGGGGTPQYYQRFWNSAMRWLIKDPELKLLDVNIPRERYAPDESLEARIEVTKPDYTAAKNIQGTVELARRPLDSLTGDGANERMSVESTSFSTDADGRNGTDGVVVRHTATFPLKKPGIYNVSVRAQTPAGTLEDEEIALVAPDVREFRNIIPRNDLLGAIAGATGGFAGTLPGADLSNLRFRQSDRVEVNKRRVVHLWDSVVVFALILILLGTEWTLRRRWGRL